MKKNLPSSQPSGAPTPQAQLNTNAKPFVLVAKKAVEEAKAQMPVRSRPTKTKVKAQALTSKAKIEEGKQTKKTFTFQDHLGAEKGNIQSVDRKVSMDVEASMDESDFDAHLQAQENALMTKSSKEHVIKDKQIIANKNTHSKNQEPQVSRCRSNTPDKMAKAEKDAKQNLRNSQIVVKGLTRQNLDQLDATFKLPKSKNAPLKKDNNSPSRILKKLKERQERADLTRKQIEENRQCQLEKIHARQQLALAKAQTDTTRKQQEQLRKITERINHARENRHKEMSNIIQKAQNDIQSVEDIKYIMKMTNQNLQLDINNKQSETEERRNQFLREQMKKLDELKIKEEEVLRRKHKINEIRLHQLREAEKKRQRAAQRKKEIHNKKKNATLLKRKQVLERKSRYGEQRSGMMNLVANKDNVWELIGREQDFKDSEMLQGQTDLVSIGKAQLKADAQCLNRIISFLEDGRLQLRFQENRDFMHYRKMLRQTEFLDNDSSGTCSESSEDDKKSKVSGNTLQFHSEMYSKLKEQLDYQQQMNQNDLDKTSDANASYGSIKDQMEEQNFEAGKIQTLPEIHSNLARRSNMESSLNQSICSSEKAIFPLASNNPLQLQKVLSSTTIQCMQPIITDEEQYLMLLESRMHQAIKRNILRDTMSEDLEWAQCIKNEQDEVLEKVQFDKKETRSMHSTPERPVHRENSCGDRIFGSASSRRRFKKSSRLNSRRSSISSNMHHGLQKSKSKDILVQSSSTILLESKNLQMLNKDIQGSNISKKRIRDSSRDSYDSHRMLGRSAMNTVQPRNLFQNCASQSNAMFTEDTMDQTSQSQATNFGSQMNQLITTMKPMMSFLPTNRAIKLSSNAMKYIFPIREQQILFKRPGIDGQFTNARVIIKLEDINKISDTQSKTTTLPDSIHTGQETPRNSMPQEPSAQALPLEQTPPKRPAAVGKIANQNSNKASQPSSKVKTYSEAEETVFKECAVKYLLGGQYNDLIKNEDAQKSIELNDEDLNNVKKIEAFLDRLESADLCFRYCRLCESILADPQEQKEVTEHLLSEASLQNDDVPLEPTDNLFEQPPTQTVLHVRENKQHKKLCAELGIKDPEDQCFSILSFQSCPGDISKELVKEKEKALKRKVKRLKLQLNQMATTHESASLSQPWKDYSSQHKKALQIRCIDLEKQVLPVIRDYEALEANLKEILKLLSVKNQGDLMLFRKLRYIPTLVEICKRILICPKQEFKHLGKVIELSIKIIQIFCTLRENRNYMLQTNRIMPLVDLLNWCMNRPTQIFFGISFLPQLFSLVTLHIKHKTPFECIQSKEFMIEILICSSLMAKIKTKFTVINYPMALVMSQMNGQVPMFLLKSITFIEALTSIVSNDARFRPAYERNAKLGEHYLFVIQNTELFGVVQMLATLLLTHSEQFKSSCNSAEMQVNTTKVMPQTFLSLTIVTTKVLNNIMRIDLKFMQELIGTNEIISDQLFHLLNYLLVYTHENYDKCEDTKELLHETLMFIGYFCMLNESNQQILHRGENTILQKLCNLPFPYFSDKKLKEILFPTLISASYKSERSVAIMNQELSLDPIIKFLQGNMKEELPRIMEEEFDYQSISSFGEAGKQKHSRRRSPSISSTTSSLCSVQMESISGGNCPYLPLFMRFPKSKWQDAIEFYTKLNE